MVYTFKQAKGQPQPGWKKIRPNSYILQAISERFPEANDLAFYQFEEFQYAVVDNVIFEIIEKVST